MQFSPDGETLAIGMNTVDLYDVATGNKRASLDGHGGTVGSLAFSPDGKTLAAGTFRPYAGRAVSPSASQTVELWNTAAGQIEPASDLDATDNVTSNCECEGEVGAVRALHSCVTPEHFLSPDDAPGHCECADKREVQIESVAQVWPNLPQHVRDSILLLVKAALCE